jgi:hypothetical protein
MAYWSDSSGSGRILTSRPESDRSVPDFGSFGRNPTNPDSNETVRISAFISYSCYSSWNPVGQLQNLVTGDFYIILH